MTAHRIGKSGTILHMGKYYIVHSRTNYLQSKIMHFENCCFYY